MASAQLFPLFFSTFFTECKEFFTAFLLSQFFLRISFIFCSVAAQKQGSLLFCLEREAALNPWILDSGGNIERKLTSYLFFLGFQRAGTSLCPFRGL
jgi:hypothetical protein